MGNSNCTLNIDKVERRQLTRPPGRTVHGSSDAASSANLAAGECGALGSRPRGCGDRRVVATAPAHGRAGASCVRTAGVGGELGAPALDHARRERTLVGIGEAQLTKLACSPPPLGAAQWTLQLLADRLVELQVVDSIGRETVCVALKKTGCSPGKYAVGA